MIAAGEVDLGAVAGREHDRVAELSGQLGGLAVLQVETLTHLERRVMMRHSERKPACGFWQRLAGQGSRGGCYRGGENERAGSRSARVGEPVGAAAGGRRRR